MKYSFLALSIAAFLIFANSADRQYFEPDETRYVEVVREMDVSGDYLVPHYNFQPYAQKPPLFFWAVLIAKNINGTLNMRTALLPVQVSALLVLFLTLRIAVLLGFSREGPFVVFSLCSMLLFIAASRIVRMDMMLAAFVVLGYWALLEFRDKKTVVGDYLFAVAVAGGMLTKGPVALLWLYLVPIVVSLFHHRMDQVRRLFHLRVLAVWLSLFLLWLIPALAAGGPDYRNNLLFAQNISRVVSSFDHREPFYYYLLALPLSVVPHSLLALLGIFVQKRAKPGHATLLISIVLPLILFSLFSGKLVIYLLPAIPALSILAALSLRHRLSGVVVSLSSIFMGLLAVVSCNQMLNNDIPTSSVVWVLVIIGFSSAALSALYSRGLGLLLLTLSTLAWFVFPVTSGASFHFNRNTTFEIANELVTLYPDEKRYTTYRELRPSFLFVTKRPFDVVYDPAGLRMLARMNPAKPCLINGQRYERLPRKVQQMFVVESRQDIFNDSWLIITSLPGSPSELYPQQQIHPPRSLW